MRMSRVGSAVLVVALLLPASDHARAQTAEAVERFDKGLINWTQGYVEATGVGAPRPDATSAVIARLSAQRAAKVDAYRNLLETVKGVRVTSETVVQNFMTTSQRISSRVEGIVRGAVVVDERFNSEHGSYEVRVRMPLTGDLTRLMIQEVIASGTPAPGEPVPGFSGGSSAYEDELRRQREDHEQRRQEQDSGTPSGSSGAVQPSLPAEPSSASNPVPPQPVPVTPQEPSVVSDAAGERPSTGGDSGGAASDGSGQQVAVVTPQPAQPAEPTTDSSTGRAAVAAEPIVTAMNAERERVGPGSGSEWTGLVVDARGLGLKPSLMPQIIAEDGRLIYGARTVDFDDAVKGGLVGYARDVDAAVRHLRVTAEPVLVKGARAYGAKNSDVVLHQGDVPIVLQTSDSAGYLKKGRVMIVYN